MRVNWHLWSGVNRFPKFTLPAGDAKLATMGIKITRKGSYAVPTVVVDVNLMDWALPLSVHVGGPLLGKPGLTFRVGPVNIGWSIL